MNNLTDFVNTLGAEEVDFSRVFNQYHEDNFPQFVTTKTNLLCYLTQMKELNPKTMLVGEAPGKDGCALTGIPFTSLHIMSETNQFGLFGTGIEGISFRKESTASMIWEILQKLNFCPLLCNAYPFNPIDPITKKNRKPSAAETETGLTHLKALINIFKIKHIVSVGNTADTLLKKHGITHYAIPHPSYGNKQKFYDGLERLICLGLIE